MDEKVLCFAHEELTTSRTFNPGNADRRKTKDPQSDFIIKSINLLNYNLTLKTQICDVR